MTQPIATKEPTYQVFCEVKDPETGAKELLTLSPIATKDFCQAVLDGFTKAMVMGRQPHASNPHMVRIV